MVNGDKICDCQYCQQVINCCNYESFRQKEEVFEKEQFSKWITRNNSLGVKMIQTQKRMDGRTISMFNTAYCKAIC